jgi:hypothetical protein
MGASSVLPSLLPSPCRKVILIREFISPTSIMLIIEVMSCFTGENWGVDGQLELLVSTMAIKLGLAKFALEQTLLVLVYNNKNSLFFFGPSSHL